MVMSSQAQSLERKIIIQNGKFYYITVDENIQLGTLYTGSVSDPLKLAKAYALPAGRGISAETNPLAWDVTNEHLLAINFLDHSLNDRNESIKKIPISALRQWGPAISVEEVMMESIDQHGYTLNEPYLFVKNRSKYLNHFYFDAVLHQHDYWMVMTNNDELTIWRNNTGGWQHSEVLNFPITNYFSLFSVDENLYLITQEGGLYAVTLDGIKEINKGNGAFSLKSSIIIEDRDKQQYYTFSAAALNLEQTLNKLITAFGKTLELKN